jgi:hypothetical protein
MNMPRFTLLRGIIRFGAMALIGGFLGEPARAEEKSGTFETVQRAESFTVGGVGVAGTRTKQELAFRELIKQPKAGLQFRKLLDHGSPAGKMYGLLGLKLTDKSGFEEALPKFTDCDTKIETIGGCMVMRTTVGYVAKQIARGDFK